MGKVKDWAMDQEQNEYSYLDCIRADLNRLDIRGEIVTFVNRYNHHHLIFATQEDMNLFKLSSIYGEQPFVKFRVLGDKLEQIAEPSPPCTSSCCAGKNRRQR